MTIRSMARSVYSDLSDLTADLFSSEVKRVGSGQSKDGPSEYKFRVRLACPTRNINNI
jgi:hypothetical protein